MKAKNSPRRSLAKIDADLRHALTYSQWLELAQEHDQVSGASDWRDDDRTDLLHVAEIRRSIASLRELHSAQDTWGLRRKLQEVLFRHQAEFTHPELYHTAKAGTKRVVSEFLDEVETGVRYLLDSQVEGVDDVFKLEQLKRVGRVYGRPALLLSGGATLAIFHLGVVKALFEQDLLPRSISGSSMGSIIAAWACSHDNQELQQLFADPQQIARDALRPLPLKKMLDQGAVFDQSHLYKYLQALLPDMTFSEAMQHSKRILNVSVSPHTKQQSARLLNYLSSPNTLIQPSVLASCAIPGVFKPVQLMTRQRGERLPWMKGELWMDGSMQNDLPFAQLSQLLNINHFITSQANPHIVPFQAVSGENKGYLSTLAKMYGRIAFEGSTQVLDVARRKHPVRLVRDVLNTAHGIVSQRYASNDMHIQMPFKLELYPRMMQNPSLDRLNEFIRMGEQATWPQIPMIYDRTRISRLFGYSIAKLLKRMETQPLTGQ